MRNPVCNNTLGWYEALYPGECELEVESSRAPGVTLEQRSKVLTQATDVAYQAGTVAILQTLAGRAERT